MQIRHLRHNKIDYVLWDKCITNAKNCLVYASTWYLDVVSPGWEALVTSDYKYIMPLSPKAHHSAHNHDQALYDIGIVALEPHELHGDLQCFKLIG